MSDPTFDPIRSDPMKKLHLSAFNAAFYELGLGWHWDEKVYDTLRCHPCEKERIRIYLQKYQPHLLGVYDAGFLAEAIHAVKTRHFDELTHGGSSTAADVDWAVMQHYRRDI